jgi:hypothetical protein
MKINDKAHPAGIVLKAGIIEALPGRRVGHASEYLTCYYHVNRIYQLVI